MRFTISFHFHFAVYLLFAECDIWLQRCNFIACCVCCAHLPNDVNDAISISKDMQQFILSLYLLVPSQSPPTPQQQPPPSCISDYHLENDAIFFRHFKSALKLQQTRHTLKNAHKLDAFCMALFISMTIWLHCLLCWWVFRLLDLVGGDDESHQTLGGRTMLTTKTLIFNQYTKIRSLTEKNHPMNWQPKIEITRIDFFCHSSARHYSSNWFFCSTNGWNSVQPGWIKNRNEKRNASTCN